MIAILGMAWYVVQYTNSNPQHTVGEQLDEFNGVAVYYNGGVNHVASRNISQDGYNLGLEYQCVEFVKRYYYQQLQHKMPDSYGHAKDFYNPKLSDGQLNLARDLLQFSNPSHSKPQVNDIVIFAPSLFNRFGHVAIVSAVSDTHIEWIQQNAGPFSPTRERIGLQYEHNQYYLDNQRIVGWLRKEAAPTAELTDSSV